MLKKIVIFLLFLLFSIACFSKSGESSADFFYAWLADKQVMSSNSLLTSQNLIQSNYATVDRIANSTPMLKFYADELVKQGVPLDFVILPLMESGNNPQARSPKNALGLWQFMPLTGREWGLGVSESLDDRNDVHKSTVAAAMYLKYLYSQFNDWNLVLASYNWGSASVVKALHKGLKHPDGRINLALLPEETRNYLISFYAFNKVIRDNYKKMPLSQYPNQPFLIKINSSNLNNYVKSTPSLSNLNESVLKHMNGFDLKVVNNSPKIMLVPTDIFTQYFMPNKISFKVTSTSKSYMTCNSSGKSDYKVGYGETIETIAKKFRLSVDKLIELNPSVRYARPGIILNLC